MGAPFRFFHLLVLRSPGPAGEALSTAFPPPEAYLGWAAAVGSAGIVLAACAHVLEGRRRARWFAAAAIGAMGAFLALTLLGAARLAFRIFAGAG